MMDATRALEHLSPWLPRPLFAGARLDVMSRLASALPPWWVSGIFECRLSPHENQVDFMVCALKTRLPTEASSESAGRRLPAAARRLFRGWLSPSSALEHVPLVWMEYDLPEGEAAEPLLSVCLNPRHTTPERLSRESTQRQKMTAEYGLELMTAAPVDPELSRMIEGCARTVPSHGLEHVASLAARGSSNVRLTAYLERERLVPWLHALRWPGELAAVRALSSFLDRWPSVGVQLELGPDLTPYLAIEATSGASDEAQCRASHLLRALCGMGVVDPVRAAAVLGWPGASVIAPPSEPSRVRLGRTLYFKLVLREREPPQVKAYLGFSPRYTLA